jgi:hypothetical protein
MYLPLRTTIREVLPLSLRGVGMFMFPFGWFDFPGAGVDDLASPANPARLSITFTF